MSIASKLQKILDSKAAIKVAINGKGGTITDSTPLDEYADAIDGLPIDDGSFYRWLDGSLTSVVIPAGITTIRDYSFYNLQTLTSATIPEGVTKISSYAFYSTRLKKIVLPNSLTELGLRAFSSIGSLEDGTLRIPGGLTNIPVYAFHTTRFTEVYIAEGVQNIGAYAFDYGSERFYDMPSTLLTIGDSALSLVNAGTTFLFRGNTPPTITSTSFKTNTQSLATMKIYVPDAAVATYKNATNWSAYASRIFPMSDYTE